MSVQTGISIGIYSGQARQGATQVNSSLQSVQAQAKRTEHEVKNSTQRIGSSFSSMIGPLGQFLTAMGSFMVFRQMASTISEFEQSMANVRAVTQATDIQMVDLTKKARELGATTKYSAAQAASGMEFLGRAGFKTSQIIGAMPATLNLAAAANLDLGRSADIVSNIMSAFNIRAEETVRIADALASISSKANTDVSMMGDAFKYAGPVARALGYSVEDASAAIGILSNAGLQGSMAGTGLRTILSELAAPAAKTIKLLKEYGISVSDVNPRTNDLVTIFQKLKKPLQDAGFALEVFGDRGGPASLALGSMVEELEDLTKVVNSSEGTASRMASIMNNTLSGSVLNLKSAIEELVHSTGDAGLGSGLRTLTDQATNTVRALNGSEESIQGNVTWYKFLAEAVKVASAGFAALMSFKVAGWFGSLASIITESIAAFTTASTATGGFSAAIAALGGPVTATIAVIGVIISTLVLFKSEILGVYDSVKKWIGLGGDFKDTLKITSDSIQDNVAKIKSQEEVLKIASKTYSDLSEKTSLTSEEQKKLNSAVLTIEKIIPHLTSGFRDNGDAVKANAGFTEDLKNALAELNMKMADQVWLQQAQQLQSWRDEIKKSTESIKTMSEEIEKLSTVPAPSFWELFSGSNSEYPTKEVTQKIRDLNLQVIEEKQKLKEANEQLKSQQDIWSKMRDAVTSGNSILGFFNDTQKDLSKNLDDTNKNLDTGANKIDNYALAIKQLKLEIETTEKMISSVGKGDIALSKIESMKDAYQMVIDLKVEGDPNKSKEILDLNEKIFNLKKNLASMKTDNQISIEIEDQTKLVRALKTSEEEYLRTKDLINAKNLAIKDGLEIGSKDYELRVAHNLALIEERNSLQELQKSLQIYNQILSSDISQSLKGIQEDQRMLDNLFQQGAIDIDGYGKALRILEKESNEIHKRMLQDSKDWISGVKLAYMEMIENSTNAAENVHKVWNVAFSGLGTLLTDYVTDGTFKLEEFSKSVLRSVNEILINNLIVNNLANALKGSIESSQGGGGGVIGGLFSSFFSMLSGSGGSGAAIPKFATGGIVTSPTVLLAGEKTHEAIVPLQNGAIPVNLRDNGKRTKDLKINITIQNNSDGMVMVSERQLAENIGRKILRQMGRS